MAGYLDLPGTDGVDASTPDAAALDILDKLTIEIDCALDWNSDKTVRQYLVTKWRNSPDRSWVLVYASLEGVISLLTSDTGSNSRGADSPDLSSIRSDGERVVIKVVKSGTAVNWFLDGAPWGTEDTLSSADIHSGPADLHVGGRDAVLSPANGQFFKCKIWDDTTLVFDADFTDLTVGEVNAAAFVEDSTNAATVSLNGADWLYSGLAAVTGTAVAGGVLESEITVGGETIILTLTGDKWVATVGDDNAITDAIIAGIVSDGSEGAGWNNEVSILHTDISRDSDTQVTIVLATESTYAITSDETITVTIPATALEAGGEVVATPTFDVSEDGGQLPSGWTVWEYGDTMMAYLIEQGATSNEVVGALNELNGTTGVAYDQAYRTFFNL